MIATLWTADDCQQCDQAKEQLKTAAVPFREIPADRLISGEIRNVDALTQLADQGMAAPVISINGRYVKPSDLADELKGTK